MSAKFEKRGDYYLAISEIAFAKDDQRLQGDGGDSELVEDGSPIYAKAIPRSARRLARPPERMEEMRVESSPRLSTAEWVTAAPRVEEVYDRHDFGTGLKRRESRRQKSSCSASKCLAVILPLVTVVALIAPVVYLLEHLRGDFDRQVAKVTALERQLQDTTLMIKALREEAEKHHCESGTLYFGNFPFAASKWPQVEMVHFSRPFASPPSIMHGVTTLDSDFGTNTRFAAVVRNVTRHGFHLAASQWSNSRLYALQVSWMACTV